MKLRPFCIPTYDEAIRDGYLVNYSIYRARTKFQRDGIKGANLTEEERNLLIERGHDPDELDYAGSELEKTVSNLGTLRRQWEEIIEECYKDRAGQLPGKTIVFAVSQAHARRLVETFDEMFPDWAGTARVITSDEEYKGELLKAFKNDDYPRIAVTVDLLETGVDIPEAVNLVFMKPVHSRIKLMQMIGRGTRNDEACRFREWLPEGHKKDFKILDFWENEFDLKGDPAVAQSLPVLVTIFNTRLDQMEHYVAAKAQHTPQAQTVIAALRGQINRINPQTYGVKGVWREIEGVWREDFWTYLNAEKLKFLRLKVGPLLRLVSATDTEAATFTSKIERLKRGRLAGQESAALRETIRQDVGRLPDFVFNNARTGPLIRFCLSSDFDTAEIQQLDEVIAGLADQMKNRRDKPNPFLTFDLRDTIQTRGYIQLKGGSQPVYVEEYRKLVEKDVIALIDSDPVIAALGKDQPVSDREFIELERTLRQKLGKSQLEINEDNVRKAFGYRVGSLLEFLRVLLGLSNIPDYGEIVRRQFEGYIGEHTFEAEQIAFLRTLKDLLSRPRPPLKPSELYKPPLDSLGQNAVERLFTQEERQAIITFSNSLAVA